MYYIYKITNNINEKVYIGKTNNPYQRMHSHLHYAKHGATNDFYKENGKYNPIHKAINKYGVDNFYFDIIDQDENEDIIFQFETKYILQYKSNDPTYGYNLTLGGEGSAGRLHTEKTKNIIRDKATGRLHSAETK